MSTNIDRNIVEMGFDNVDFEKNASTTMNTLDKLREKLDMSSAAKSFDSFEKSANNINLSGFESTIDSIGDKFSSLQVIAASFLHNLTTDVYNAGKTFVNSLTSDNISAGWRQYDEINVAVGTLVSQGFELEDVLSNLGKLEWFTDETSYELNAMIASLGAFTANNVGLKDSVDMMQGIALWAAKAGRNASVASHVMDMMGKMGGFMTRESWTTIAKAQMDNAEIRQMFLDEAVKQGTLVKTMDGLYQATNPASKAGATPFGIENFIDQLTTGRWLTQEVFIATMKQYSNATEALYRYVDITGETTTDTIKLVKKIRELAETSNKTYNEIIDEMYGGDELLKELVAGVDDFSLSAFEAGQEARTFADAIGSVTAAVKTGWAKTFEFIFGDYKEAKELWTDFSEYLYDIFAEGGNQRNAMLEEWKDSGGRDDFIESFWNIAYAISDVINIVKGAWSEIFPPKTAESIINITKSLKQFTSNLRLFDDEAEELNDTGNNLKRTLKGVFALFDIGRQLLGYLLKPIKTLLGYAPDASLNLLEVTAKIGDFIVKIDELMREGVLLETSWKKIKDTITGLAKGINESVENIWHGETLSSITTAISNGFTNFINRVKSFFSELKTLDFKLFDNFSEKTQKILSPLRKAFTWVTDAIKKFIPILSEIGEALGAAFTIVLKVVKSFVEGLGEIFKNAAPVIGKVFSLFVKILDIASELISKSLDSASKLLGEMDWKKALGIGGGVGIAAIGIAISDWIRNLGAVRKKLAGEIVAWQEIIDSISYMLDSLMAPKRAEALLKIAGAAAILTLCVLALSSLPWIDLIKGLIGVGAIIAMFILLLEVIENDIDKAKSIGLLGVGILLLSIALKNLVPIIAMFGTTGEAWWGLLGLALLIGALIASMVIINKYVKNFVVIETVGKALLILSVGVLILSYALKPFMNANFVQVIQGLLSFVVIMAGLGLLAEKSKGMEKEFLAVGLGLFIIAKAIKYLEKPIMAFGTMDTGSLIQGAGAVVILIGAILKIIDSLKADPMTIIAAAGAIFIIALALDSLVISIALLSILPDMTKVGIAAGIIAAFMVILAGLTWVLSTKAKPESALSAAAAIWILAKAVNSLLLAIVAISFLPDLGKVAIAAAIVVGITSVLAAITWALSSKGTKGTLVAAASMFILITAIDGLLVAMMSLAVIPLDSIIPAFIGVAIGLLAMSASLYILSKLGPKVLIGAAALLIVAIAVDSMFVAMAALTLIPYENILSAFLAISVVIVVMAAALGLLAELGPKVLIGAAAMLILAVAIDLLIIPVSALCALPWKKLAIGATVLAVFMLVMTAILAVPAAFGPAVSLGMIAAAAAILVLAIAIDVMTPALIALSVVPFVALIGAVGALAILFLALGLTAAILAPLSPVILALAAALLMIASSCKIGAEGIAILVGAITALVLLGDSAQKAITDNVRAVIALIPEIIDAAFDGFLQILNLLRDNLTYIVEIIGDFLIELITTLLEKGQELWGTIAEGLITGLLTLLEIIDEYIEDISRAATNVAIHFILGFLTGIADNMDKIVETALYVFESFVNALAKAIEEGPALLERCAWKMIGAFIKGWLNWWNEKTKGLKAGAEFVGGIIQSIWDGITSKAQEIWDAAKELGNKVIDAFKRIFNINSPSKETEELGKYVDEGLSKGIRENSRLATNESRKMGKSILEELEDTLDEPLTNAESLLDFEDTDPVIKPVMDLSDIQTKTKELFGTMMDINSFDLGTSFKLSSDNNSFDLSKFDTNELLSNLTNNQQTPNQTSIENTFNIYGDDPKAIADEVSKLLQQDVNEGDAVWA